MADPFSSCRDDLEQLVDDFLADLRAGRNPSVQEFVARRPALADDLRSLLATAVLLEQNVPAQPPFETAALPPPTAGAPLAAIGEYSLVRGPASPPAWRRSTTPPSPSTASGPTRNCQSAPQPTTSPGTPPLASDCSIPDVAALLQCWVDALQRKLLTEETNVVLAGSRNSLAQGSPTGD